jgi:hypothetical protein
VFKEIICWFHEILRINTVYVVNDTDQLFAVVETLPIVSEIH